MKEEGEDGGGTWWILRKGEGRGRNTGGREKEKEMEDTMEEDEEEEEVLTGGGIDLKGSGGFGQDHLAQLTIG